MEVRAYVRIRVLFTFPLFYIYLYPKLYWVQKYIIIGLFLMNLASEDNFINVSDQSLNENNYCT